MKRRLLLSIICTTTIFLTVATAVNYLSPINNQGAVETATHIAIRKITQGALQTIGCDGRPQAECPLNRTDAKAEEGRALARVILTVEIPWGASRERVFGANEAVQITGQDSDEAQTFDICPMGIFRHMSRVTITVLLILLVMSIWSIVIMVERYVTFSAAMNQSREFAPKAASSLMRLEIDEAINLSDKYKESHLAMVVSAGLKEFRDHQLSGEISSAVVDASKRALQRATAIKIAEFRRGLSGLATIGSIALFVGLFGTLFGIINTLEGMSKEANAGISAVAGGIAEALGATVVGLAVAVPAVWLFKYFTSKVDKFVIEMEISSAELIDFFLKHCGKK